MELIVPKQVRNELKAGSKDVIMDVFALIDDLMAGKLLSLPISRPLPSISKGLHELRLSGLAGEFRVFYVIKAGVGIYIIHATPKKSQKN